MSEQGLEIENPTAQGSETETYDPSSHEPSAGCALSVVAFCMAAGAVFGYLNWGLPNMGMFGHILGLMAGAFVGFFIGILFLV